MTGRTVPSNRLLWLVAGLTAATLGLLIVPEIALLLVALFLTLAVLAVLDRFLTPGTACLKVRREAPLRVWVLGTHPVVLRLSNSSRVRLLVQIRDSVPSTVQASVEDLLCLVEPAGEAVLGYDITTPIRGQFAWGPIHLRYRSLLGLWERGAVIGAEADLQVYPAVDAIERYHLLARTDHLPALGVRRMPFKGASWEFESLREFVNGDDTRLMDWKASARRQRLIVRNHRDERNQSVLLLVDAGRLMTAEENGVSKLDLAVNAALLLSHVALGRGDRVGLCAFASQVLTWVQPRPGAGQMRLLSAGLYDLRGQLTESDHTRCLRQVGVRHNKRSLLVFLTDFVDAETASDMVAAVRQASKRHVVLFCAFKDPFLERIAHDPPVTREQAFRQAVALGLLRERREVLERLRLLGAQVVDADPNAVSPALLNKYLEVSLRGLL